MTALTVMGISWIGRVPTSLRSLGMISYSLYLLHVPIGGRVINLSKRFVDNDLERFLAVGFALTISIVVAWFFYHLIETRSHLASRHFGLRRQPFKAAEIAELR